MGPYISGYGGMKTTCLLQVYEKCTKSNVSVMSLKGLQILKSAE
jgi:hypothetical protein